MVTSTSTEVDFSAGSIETHLVGGCIREAERSEIVALRLDALRSLLDPSFHAHLFSLAEEMRAGAFILRDIADKSQVYSGRVPIVLNYLNIVLPCLSRTLRDITAYYEDRSMTKEIRWRTMYHKMSAEAQGMTLSQRFHLYNQFLTQLRSMLVKSPDFELNDLEMYSNQIMKLREARGIPAPPMQVGPPVRASSALVLVGAETQGHWAQQIFSLPLPSRTALKHQKSSISYGPHFPLGHYSIAPGSKLLFKRAFEQDRISVQVIQNGTNLSPYLLIRTLYRNQGWYSMMGAHELCVSREGSALQLKRWCRVDRVPKPWALLYFLTWEEMVLFYCSFLSLKMSNTLTVSIDPAEYKLRKETRLFQAQIIDDGFKHSLIVYRDVQTNGLRLHAAVWEGELRECPVWTAFITHQSASPSWLVRKSKHRVWIADIQLYVFCQTYRQVNQRKGKAGAFEIYFVSQEAAQRFKQLFDQQSDQSSSADTSEASSPTEEKGKAIAN